MTYYILYIQELYGGGGVGGIFIVIEQVSFLGKGDSPVLVSLSPVLYRGSRTQSSI